MNESGQPAAGALVYVCAADRSRVDREEPFRVGPDGSFHLDQLDPVRLMSIYARVGDAATDGTITVRPGEVKGKLTLTVDAKHALRIRGLATDIGGKRIAGAEVSPPSMPSFARRDIASPASRPLRTRTASPSRC